MKKIITIILLGMSLFVGCENIYRDELAQIHKEIDDINARLDAFCNETNTNIAALQTMIAALQAKDYVTGVVPVMEDGKEVGYQITFDKSGKVTIYHGKDGANGADGANGKDGKDGYTPQIGVKLHTDGLYYWTLDGEWLTDENGNMIKAIGVDGEDGKDGEDAIAPKLKIEDGNWYVSVDGGVTWDYLGQATGDAGQDGATGPQGPQGEQGPQGDKGDKGDQGDSIFSDIDVTEEYVIITLADGQTQIILPTWTAFNALKTQVDKLNSDMQTLQALVAAWEANDYVKSVTPLPDGSGYVLTFVHSGAVTIYHGKDGADGSNGADGKPGADGSDGEDGSNGADGKDGHTPVISVKKDTDGIWYWTIDGEWLLDEAGNKVVAVGRDGQDGANGADGSNGIDGAPGQDGEDGKDGVTPRFKIENGMWYVSYDEGQTWELAGQATGNQGGSGEAGDSMFAAVDSSNPDYIVIALTDGRVLKFPTWSAFEALKAMCNEMNTNISSLQSIVTALQNNDYVTGVTEITDNGKVIGYTIHFSKSAPAVIYHGEDGADGAPGQDGTDGKDGYVPNIGLKQDTDGVWYWTLDGEWMLDGNGQKVKASAKDGVNGSNGTDGNPGSPGQDGSDGKDGISPKLKIENGNWYVSYDHGATWEYLAPATGDKGDIGETGPTGPQGPEGPQGPAGEDGKDGDSMFSDIEITAEYIIITLADGVTKIQIPTWKSFSELAAKVELLNADVTAIKALVEAWNQNDYVKSVTPLADGSGYVLEFVKSGKVTIYHGQDGSDGKDGHSPVVSVRQDTDGVWYWTIDGEWLLNEEGNKVVAVGKDGAPGADGTDGADGADGVTPKFKIEEGFWYVSYDNGNSWEMAGQATGNTGGAGEAGDSLFAAVDSSNEDFIVIVLTDGRTLKFPTWAAFEELKVLCNQMNTNLSSLQTLVNSNDYVTGVTEIWDNGEVIGYTISFTKSKPVVIYHGKNGKDGVDGDPGQDGEDGKDGADGKDGYVPNIGLKQATDGVWYWTLDGEWMLDSNGQRVKASAKDGVDGSNGSDGAPGNDGISPKLKIENGNWYVSYDHGATWEYLAPATGDKGDIGETGPTGPQGPEGPQGPAGEDGKDGDSMFSDIEVTAEYVIITLADGETKIQLPTWKSFSELAAKVELLNADVTAIKALVEAWNQNDYVKSVTPLADGSGYVLEFVKSGKVTIYHGQDGSDGKDGHSPVVSVRQDTDGVWYWTIDGEWLLNEEGNKVVAVGKDGAPGADGTDGADGKDGVTPKFKIEEGFWYVSYDNGNSWEMAGQATGNTGGAGEAGDSLFAAVDSSNEDFIVVVLTDGRTLKFPTWAAFEELKTLCNQMNTNLSSLQTLVNSNDYVTGVTEIWDNGEVIGYTISFTKSKPVVIYHGKNGKDGLDGADGKDGYVPNIGLKQATDGVWYWTLDGEWMLDSNGQRVKASGKDGADGSNGTNGQDGQNGVTPRLKIENGYWYISYDNGSTWEQIGQATGDKGDIGETGPQGPTGPEGPQGPAGTDGEDGKDGDTLISDIEITDDYVLITLADGQQIKIPTWAAHQALEQKVNQMNTNIEAIQTILTALQNNDYVTGVTKIYDGGKEIGYTINFSKSGSVTIYHGKDGQNGANGSNGTDGKDGHTPAIAVKQDTDDVWYWTIDGEWLLDSNGNKVKAVGTDGQDGTNGASGKDGVTPKFKIENGYWYVSYDNGQTWEEEPLGQATGDQGDSIFSDIDCSNEDYVFITLSDGQTIKLLTWSAKDNISNIVSIVRSMTYIPKYSDGQARVEDGVTELDFQILPKKYTSVVAENWESLLSIKSIYPITRAVAFNDLPILSCVADEANGVITLTVSCASLSIDYYYGTQSVNAALYLSNGNEEIASDYIPFAPYYQPDEIWYTSTDGKIVTPYISNPFDVAIISNKYENGKGVIKLDGDPTTIAKNAFKSKKTLSSIMIPHKVTTINDSAFGSCTSLNKVYCNPSTPPAIYATKQVTYDPYKSTVTSVFEKNSGLKIYVPVKHYQKYLDAADNSVSSGNVSQFNWNAYAKNIMPLYLLEE